MLEKY